MREIEKFAQEVTRDTIAKHEERFRNGVPDVVPKPKPPDTGGPAKLDRGSFEDALGTVERIDRPFDPERLAAKRATRAPDSEVLEAALVKERLDLLLGWHKAGREQVENFPEWAERIRKVWSETLALSKNLDVPDAEARSNATDAIMKVLDESNARFGDWRFPRAPDGRPIYFVVKGA